MRLAGQAKGGFYPVPAAAITHAASFLRAPEVGPFAILDPCAGEGEAFRQLLQILGCPLSRTYVIELDDSRAQTLRHRLSGSNILAPADFVGCRANANSFSFIWLNPPFDDSYGGYRVEERFLWRATEWLMPTGVMAFVCPEDVFNVYSEGRQHFLNYYENCTITPFPETCRRFGEIIVLGHKRKRPAFGTTDVVRQTSWKTVEAPREFVYRIPTSNGPRVFEKVDPTESELRQILLNSPLRSHMTSAVTVPLPCPPLPLGIGHVALLLASGHLNGIVQPDVGPPHLVRGTARKRSIVSDVSESENGNGSTTTRTTISERIELIIRTIDQTGQLQTFSEADSSQDNGCTISS